MQANARTSTATRGAGHEEPVPPGATPALSPAEWQLASTQRAQLYASFSLLYAHEVSEQLYRSHFAGDGLAPFAALAELGLGAEVERLDTAIATLRAEPLPRLELAADFAQLFLLDGRTSALPYASAYEDKVGAAPLFGAAEARMRERLAARELAIQADFREPADHLAVTLALMADLAKKDAERSNIALAAAEQAGFVRDALLAWLPHFVDRCQQARPRFDVYPALSTLLIGFVRVDLRFLDDIADNAPPAG